jgi:hypothetical protein
MSVETIDVNAAAESEEGQSDAEKAAARGDDFTPTGDDDGGAGTAGAGGDAAAAGKGDDDPATLAAVAGDDDDAAGSKMVPHARFNEVNSKLQEERDRRIAAETEARVLREQGAAAAGKGADKGAESVDLKDLRKQHHQAMMEGDEDKALELADKIDGEVSRQAEERALARFEQREQERQITNTAAAVIEKYPFLNSNGAEANKEAIADVIDMRDVYIARGKTPADALRLAAEKIGKQYAKADDGDDDDKGNKGNAADERNKQAITRNAAAASAQPPRADGGKGQRTTRATEVDVSQMDDTKFRSLPKEEKRKLRGDVV